MCIGFWGGGEKWGGLKLAPYPQWYPLAEDAAPSQAERGEEEASLSPADATTNKRKVRKKWGWRFGMKPDSHKRRIG